MDQGETPPADDTSDEQENEQSSNPVIQRKVSSITQESGSATQAIGDLGNKDPKEVSAATIGRMLGLATTSELTLIQGKIDLLVTRVSNLTTRMEKVLTTLQSIPTGSDLDRVDVQIGALRSMIRDALLSAIPEEPKEEGKEKSMKSARIITNNDDPEDNAEDNAEDDAEDDAAKTENEDAPAPAPSAGEAPTEEK